MGLRSASLRFDLFGKLERLNLAGQENLLHEYSHAFDLGGRYFRPAGWDECFPTIDPYAGSPVMGDLVGLPPHITEPDGNIQQNWVTTRFEAQRTFEQPTDHSLLVRFRATNRMAEALEFLWASHALFATRNLLKFQAAGGLVLDDFRLDGSEAKLFHPNQGPVELIYPAFRAILTTDQPWWGIWLNRGGWPAESAWPAGIPRQPFCCLGVEATSTPGEVPNGNWLLPGAAFEGRVTITIVENDPQL